MTLRDILNGIKWNPEEKGKAYEVTYIHRGAPEDKRTIPFSSIKDIHSSWFTCIDPDGEEATIPFHRVLEVRDTQSGKTVWRKGR